MLGLRIRVNNTSDQEYDNVTLKYRLKKNASETWALDAYYTENWNVSIVEQDDESVVIGVTVPHLGTGFSPNGSGVSVGVHRTDWQPMNKSSEKGFPLGETFVSAISYDVYQGSLLIAGSSVADHSQDVYNLRFVGVQPHNSFSHSAWIEIENYGASSVNLKNVYLKWPSDNGDEIHKIGNYDLKAGGRIRLCVDGSLECPEDDFFVFMPLMRMGFVGEFILASDTKVLDYMAWGVAERIYAAEAREANIHYSPIRYDFNNIDEYWHLVTYGTFYKLINKKWCSFNSDEDHLVSSSPIPVSYVKEETFYLEENAVDGMVRFAWHPIEDAVGYNIAIKRAGGTLVAEEFCYRPIFDIRLEPGEYEWKVSTLLKNDVYVVNDAWSAYHEGWNRKFVVVANGVSDTHLLQVPAYGVHKDTRMLVLNWGDHIAFPAISWDHPDEFVFSQQLETSLLNRGIESNGNILYGEIAWRCWAVGAQILNAYYGGNVTQDEMKFYGKVMGEKVNVYGKEFSRPERDKIIGPFGLWGAGSGHAGEAKRLLKWALRLDESDIDEWMAYKGVSMLESIPEDIVKGYIDEGRPMYVGNSSHIMILDGYRTMRKEHADEGTFQIHLVNLYNGGESGWFDNDSRMGTFWISFIPKIPQNPRMTDPRVHMDSDGDGIVDFDEEERFHTSPYMKDSDGDGIEDKEEIRLYTLKEPYLKEVLAEGMLTSENLRIGDVFPSEEEIFDIARPEIFADIDGNGIRAELDNGTGIVPTFVDVAEWDAPTGVAIYAFDNLNVYDDVQCFGPWHGYCKIVSESSSNYYAISIGANAVFGDLVSKGGVQIRQGAHIVGDVSIYSMPVAEMQPEIYQGADMTGTVHSLNVGAWPYVVSDNMVHSLSDKHQWNDLVVRSGQTVTIDSDVNLRSLKVESGATLKLGSCEINVGDIVLDIGSRVEFIAPGRKTLITADGNLVWKADIVNSDLRTVAKGFKLIEYASGFIHIEGDWAGTLHARWANLTIGQVKKLMYGRFVAESVNVGQGLRLYRVDFDPISYADMV